MEPLVLCVHRKNSFVKMPIRSTAGAAGYDICSNEEAGVEAYSQSLIRIGIMIVIPHGYYGRIASCFSLALKHQIEVMAGVIDEDYRGEIKVLLRNHSGCTFYVEPRDRIAQLIIEKIAYPTIVEVNPESTERDEHGFGSTGK